MPRLKLRIFLVEHVLVENWCATFLEFSDVFISYYMISKNIQNNNSSVIINFADGDKFDIIVSVCECCVTVFILVMDCLSFKWAATCTCHSFVLINIEQEVETKRIGSWKLIGVWCSAITVVWIIFGLLTIDDKFTI